MPAFTFTRPVEPDVEGFLAVLRRQGQPKRVHVVESWMDVEMQQAVCDRFDLLPGPQRQDEFHKDRRQIAWRRFLGYDYAVTGLEFDLPVSRLTVPDPSALPHQDGRSFVNEQRGPVASWEDFEKYRWPDPHQASDRFLVWYEKNLPEDMCIVAAVRARFAYDLIALMGYETLCYALYDRRDLVAAIARKLRETFTVLTERVVQFSRVRCVWNGDDMGFKTSTLLSPEDLREFALPGHKALAGIAHRAGRPYVLHTCGQVGGIMPDLIDDVGIDAKHSFEDEVTPVEQAKALYGNRIAILGGIDVGLLARADETALRRRVRQVLDACIPGGGYALGSGNSITNYTPMDNFLAMLDEGRRYGTYSAPEAGVESP